MASPKRQRSRPWRDMVTFSRRSLLSAGAALTGAAATTPVWTRDRSALFLLPALVPLALAPRTNPRSGAHWRVAVAAAPSYLGALLARR